MFIFALHDLFSRVRIGRLFDGQEAEDRAGLEAFFHRSEAEHGALLKQVKNDRGGWADLNPARHNPHFDLMETIVENMSALDRLLDDRACLDMREKDAWAVIEFLKSNRKFIDEAREHTQDAKMVAAVEGYKRRYSAMEDGILDKLVAPLSNIPLDGFLWEMRSRHLPFDMNTKLGTLLQRYAFVNQEHDR